MLFGFAAETTFPCPGNAANVEPGKGSFSAQVRAVGAGWRRVVLTKLREEVVVWCEGGSGTDQRNTRSRVEDLSACWIDPKTGAWQGLFTESRVYEA